MFAFCSWVAGTVAGCCCRVPLLVLLQWQASPGAVQRAGLLFIFPPRFQVQKGLGGYAFTPRFGLVLVWLRFFLLMLRLRWCCEQHKQHKQRKEQRTSSSTSSSTSSEPARAARAARAACAACAACAAAGAACAVCAACAACVVAGAACAACAACAASAAGASGAAGAACAASAPAASAASAAAGSDRRRVATLRQKCIMTARALFCWFSQVISKESACWLRARNVSLIPTSFYDPQWIIAKNNARDVTSAAWYELSRQLVWSCRGLEASGDAPNSA